MTDEELEQIPPLYRWLLRLLLKVPNPRFPFFVVKRITWIEGVFWAIMAPVLLMVYFLFSVWLVAFLSLNVSFPLNVMIGFLIPGAILVVFIRISLERAILSWRYIRGPSAEWNVAKGVAELEKIYRRRNRRH